MNKKGGAGIVILIVVIIIVLVMSIGAYLFFNRDVSSKDSLQDSLGRLKQALEEQTEEENSPTSLEECPQITDSYDRDSCYFNFLAKKEQVSSLEQCDKITVNTAWKTTCYNKFAKISGDKTICADIEPDLIQDKCYFDVACEIGDISICEMFEEDKGTTYSSTVLCYKCVAIKNNDESICEKIHDNGVKEDCLNNFR